MRLLGECRGSIDQVKRMGRDLKEEGSDSGSGLADACGSGSGSGNTILYLVLLVINN